MNRRLIALAAGLALVAMPAAASPAQAAPTCSGPTVARTDVDGDSRRDTVTVQQVGTDEYSPKYRLCVATAAGRVSSVVDTAYTSNGSLAPFYGAAGLDGERGTEIVLRAGIGAHSQLFHVFSWRGGRLVRQNAPDRRAPEWYIDCAMSVIQGYEFSTRRGVRHLVTTYGEKTPSVANYAARQTTFRWSKGGWVRGTTLTMALRDGGRVAEATYGWNGVALPKG